MMNQISLTTRLALTGFQASCYSHHRSRLIEEKGSRETRCLIEGHPRLVAIVYESDNNVVSQRLVEKL